MKKFKWFFCAALMLAAILLAPQPSHASRAELWGPDKEHAKKAFYSAGRHNWHDAITHAARAQNTLLRTYITWLALQDWESDFDFSAFEAFLRRNPGWPDENRLILRAEDLLFGYPDQAPLANKIRWFRLYPPISGKGKIAQAEMMREAGTGDAKTIARLIREAWRTGDFAESREKELLQRYRGILRREDHIARIDHLIWDGQTGAAARLLFTVPESYRHLFEARIRLQLNKPGVTSAIAQVPLKLKSDPGLMYERMKWRERKRLYDGVEEILLAAPKVIPHPEKWWHTRHYAVREAMQKKQFAHALRLLENHGQTGGAELAEALWLKGWISLAKFGRAQAALEAFTRLEQNVSYPVSLARGAYWSGRAAQALGKTEEARIHYARASTYSTTFYGQLAATYIQSEPRLSLPSIGRLTSQQQNEFERDPRVRAVYLLAEMGREDEAYRFIKKLMEDADSHSKALLTAELGKGIGKRHFSVRVSKIALKQHLVLPTTSYPYYAVRFKPAIEPELMWAVTRQESLFDHTAQSRAGAKGLMQLMPATAREVAHKLGLRYSPSKLNEASYNLQLGSYYLATLVDQFDGSYVKAIAAYNAGGSRVRAWETEFGDPGKNPEAVVNWIESIPYSETRNYVQRVLENLQVYRAMLAPSGQEHIQLRADLAR